MKVVYKSGHLLEYAIFDRDELYLAKVNSYRILLDRLDIGERMKQVQEKTVAECNNSLPDNRFLAGQFLTNILVGMGRFRRGEKISANFFIKQSALENLIKLVIKNIPSDNRDRLDNINHRRRFEFVYPETGKRINELLVCSPDETAKGFMKIYGELILPVIGDYFPESLEVIDKFV